MLTAGGNVRNGVKTVPTALISGLIGVDAGAGGVATVTNFGTIDGTGGTAVLFGSASDRLVAMTGSQLIGEARGGGGTLELASGTGTITGLGAVGAVSGAMTLGFTGFATYQLDGGSWTLGGGDALAAGQVLNAHGATATTLTESLSNAGLLEATTTAGLILSQTTVANIGGTITAASGSKVLLEGVTIIGGVISSTGAGKVLTANNTFNVLDGSVSTLTLPALTSLTVADTTYVILKGNIVNNGKIALSAVTHSAQITIGGTGVTLSGGGAVTLSANAGNLIAGASGIVLTNVDNKITGGGAIGGGSLTIVNQANGLIEQTGAVALNVGTGSHTIVNAGIIEAAGAGGMTVKSVVANSGLLEAVKGNLTLTQAVTGTGSAIVNAATLDFASTFTENVKFSGTTGVLELAKSTAYTGVITGFSKTGGTQLDLLDIGFTTGVTKATYVGNTTSGVLMVTDGIHTASINLVGNYTRSTFVVGTDSHGGTLVNPLKLVLQAPAAAAVTQGTATVIPALGLSEAGPAPGETFTVTLADANGLLSATGTGVSGSGTTSLTLIGSLANLNADLASVKDIDTSIAPDTIQINARDSLGNAASPTNMAIVVNRPLTTLVRFVGPSTVEFPFGSLIADAAGDLFGTTAFGASGGDGTVFEIAKTAGGYASAPTILVSFTGPNGDGPIGSLIADAAGDLFGTTEAGGVGSNGGTVFEIVKTPGGYGSGPTTLVTFTYANGSNPEGSLIADAAGDLFGTTTNGVVSGDGTVFEIAKIAGGYASAPTTIVSFTGANGSAPVGGLMADAAGDLFGTTSGGGAIGYGTVFEIARTAGSYASAPTILVSFAGANGSYPSGSLIADAAGDLFGTTDAGGANGYGTVFEIAKTAGGYASAPTTLVSFTGANGSNPMGSLIADAVGNLFGTTYYGGVNGDGTVFEIAKMAGGYASAPTILVSFTGTNGGFPRGGLIADASGDLFGTTSQGVAAGNGTVFEITNSGFVVGSSIPGAPATATVNQDHATIYDAAAPASPSTAAMASAMAGLGGQSGQIGPWTTPAATQMVMLATPASA